MKLTDRELIDYTLKFETDPVRIRLASVMDNMPGFILDSLEEAGMDPETCLFENTWNCGQYIHHLEQELEIYHDENADLRAELEELKARTVIDLIAELRQEIKVAEYNIQETNRDRMKAVNERDDMKSKLSMWTKLNASPDQLR